MPEANEKVKAQRRIFDRATEKFIDRSLKYGESWREGGWRANLMKTRLKAARAFDSLFSPEPSDVPDVDDLIDLINYAAFTIRLIEEGDRDGTWRYGSE